MRALLLFVGMSLLAAGAQDRNLPGAGAASEQSPVAVVTFKESGTIPGLLTSPVLEYPMQCAGSTVFVRMFQPPTFSDIVLYSISNSEAVNKYSKDLIDDLYDVDVRSYFPVDSGVIMLVYATRDNEKGKATTVLPDNARRETERYKGGHQYYLATFDRDGTYKHSVEIDHVITPRQFAVFSSGVFLVLGVDTVTSSAEIVMLKSDGTFLHRIEMPESFARWTAGQQKSIRGLPQGFGVIPASQLMSFQGNILVVPIKSRAPVLEVKPTGEVRVVELQLPQAAGIASFVPSSDRWYVRTSVQGKLKPDDDLLYELDPDDGTVTRVLRAEGIGVDSVACADRNQFLAFKRDDKGYFVRLVGTPAK